MRAPWRYVRGLPFGPIFAETDSSKMPFQGDISFGCDRAIFHVVARTQNDGTSQVKRLTRHERRFRSNSPTRAL